MGNSIQSTNPPSPQLKKPQLTIKVNPKQSLPSIKPSFPQSKKPPKRIGIKKRKKILMISQESKLTSDNTELSSLEIIKQNNYDESDYTLIETCLLNHFFMSNLESYARRQIIRGMFLCAVKPKMFLFQQHSIGRFFYIIKEGELELYINNKLSKCLYKGDSFGELALLYGAPRSGSVISKTKCLFWCIDRISFRKIIEHINEINYKENIHFIYGISLFSHLSKELQSYLAKNLIKVTYKMGDRIIKEGDLSSCLYIIKEGTVECMQNQRFIRKLKSKDYFGEVSILLDTKRTMDVIAKEDCVCYVISIEVLQNMVGAHYRKVLLFNFLEHAFHNSERFNRVSPQLFENIFSIFTLKEYTKGGLVVPQGHIIGSAFYIIIEGSLISSTTDNDGEYVEYKRGCILFENELLSFNPNNPMNLKRNKLMYDLYAYPDCLLMFCETHKIIKTLGSSFKEMFTQSSKLKSLLKISLFKHVSQSKLSFLSRVIKTVSYNSGETILTQGEPGEKFYIVKKGKVEIFKDDTYVRTVNATKCFGFKALFTNENRTATAIANGDVECYTLSRRDFNAILNEELIEYLNRKMMLEDDEITLNELMFIKDLGMGSFGNVSLVKAKHNHFFYAIKAISKKQIDYEKLHKHIELEKAIMLKIDHPFITKLVKTLKNDKYLFFLMEYNDGKELWEVIRDIGILNKEQTLFYAASLLLSVEYLHSRKIIHRDLKPENVIVCSNGYIKVIDFGTCKEIHDKTQTIIGTPHYMAPEAILGESYSFQVDYWSIGIMIYEFICGCVPFGENEDDCMNVYRSVVKESLTFPSNIKDKEFIDLVKRMLLKSPLARLSNITQIKEHIYFNSFSFENLLNFAITPPYKPKQSIDMSIAIHSDKPELYKEHVKQFKKYTPYKSKQIDAKKQDEYNKWFDNF